MIPQEDYIIQELELTALTPEEQQEITLSIREHLNDLLLETTIANMSDSQIKMFKKELEKDKVDESVIMQLTAGIPGIKDKIEEALHTEWEIIKTSYQKIK